MNTVHIMRDKKSKKSTGALKAVTVVSILAVVSLGLAYGWQTKQDMVEEQVEQRSGELPAVQSNVPGEETAPVQSGGTVAWPEQEELPEPGEAVEGGDGVTPVGSTVPASAKVSNSYFKDAIFFGDSLSTGIPIYQVAGNPDTVAFAGINPDTINDHEVIVTPDGNKTMLEAAKEYGDKKKVYIMLGSNGLWMSQNTFVNGYQTFIDSVKEQYPDAVIYLQSIPPVTANAPEKYDDADNEVIREFNAVIQQLARQNDLYYLDVASALVGEDGYLPEEASPGDGMHLTPEYYNKWFEYLKTHTVVEAQK